MNPPNYVPPPWASPPAPAQAFAPPPPAPAPYNPPGAPPIGTQQNGHTWTGSGWVPTAAAAPAAPAFAPPPAPATAPPAGFAPQATPSFTANDDPAFDGVGDAQVFPQTPNFPNGDHVIDVFEMKGNVSKKSGARQIIVLATIVSSTTPTAVPGCVYKHVINLQKFGKPDLKMFMGACLGADPAQPAHLDALAQRGAFSKESILQMISAQQPFRGKRLRVSVFLNQKGTFTKHNYAPAGQ